MHADYKCMMKEILKLLKSPKLVDRVFGAKISERCQFAFFVWTTVFGWNTSTAYTTETPSNHLINLKLGYFFFREYFALDVLIL